MAPGRVPCLTHHADGLLIEDTAHQIEVMDCHVQQQRMHKLVVAVVASRRCIGVFTKLHPDGAERSQDLLPNQPRRHTHSRVMPIVLADHQHASGLLGRRHDRFSLPHRGREGLFEQHMLAGLQRSHGNRRMSPQRRCYEHGLGIRRV